ncbi:MAG: hypothetical protein K0R38_6517 [Polyangiaceae bacterium]|nr:hypothetical protein [Polyangiaceae bacterium]
MFGDVPASACAVTVEVQITSASAAVHQRCGSMRLVTTPARPSACHSCVLFDGDAQIARDSRAGRRGRGSRGAPALAVGARGLGAAGHDLDPVGGRFFGSGTENVRLGRGGSERRGGARCGHVRVGLLGGRLLGGAIRPTDAAAARVLCGARSSRRNLDFSPFGRRVHERASRRERAFFAGGACRRLRGARRLAAPSQEIRRVASLKAFFVVVLPLLLARQSPP